MSVALPIRFFFSAGKCVPAKMFFNKCWTDAAGFSGSDCISACCSSTLIYPVMFTCQSILSTRLFHLHIIKRVIHEKSANRLPLPLVRSLFLPELACEPFVRPYGLFHCRILHRESQMFAARLSGLPLQRSLYPFLGTTSSPPGKRLKN